jgi:phosphoserine phosphatase
MATEGVGETLESNSMLRMLEVARLLASPLELSELLAQIIDAGRTILGADRGTVFLYDPRTRELYSKVATGVGEIRFPIDKGIAGEAARTRLTINVPDCYADPRFNPEFDRRFNYRTRCLIAVPMLDQDNELVGVLQLLNPAKACIDPLEEKIAEALASQAGVAIQRVRLLEERMVKLKLERDLALARQIQMNVLPRSLPAVPGYDLAVYGKPAEETGGDIYDLIRVGADAAAPLLMLLADATGHGIGPALSVTQVRSMLRIGLRLDATLDQMLEHINRQLAEDLGGARFVTAFLGSLDPIEHRLHYHAAGQGPLLHYHAAERGCEWLAASTLPMGIMEDLDIEAPPALKMGPGDVVALLTDGFYEYQDAQGVQMGKDRIGCAVERHRDGTAQQILDALTDDLRAFANGAPQLDDLTAIIIKRA